MPRHNSSKAEETRCTSDTEERLAMPQAGVRAGRPTRHFIASDAGRHGEFTCPF